MKRIALTCSFVLALALTAHAQTPLSLAQQAHATCDALNTQSRSSAVNACKAQTQAALAAELSPLAQAVNAACSTQTTGSNAAAIAACQSAWQTLVDSLGGPPPALCTDPTATNQNQPLPCTYPPPPTNVAVPGVVGQTQAAAQAAIQGAGLVFTTGSSASNTVQAGSVISEAPPAGTLVPSGSTVTITVSTGPAAPPPPPPTTGTAVLDDLSGGIRQTSDGSSIWQHYQEGASGSVSVVNGALVEAVGSVFDSGGGGQYMEFYPKGKSGYTFPAGYAQSFLKSGTWNPQFNRLTFRMKINQSRQRDPGGSQTFEVGTYIRAHNNSDGSWQGDHYYHRLDPNVYAGQWITVVLNRVPQHQVGGDNSKNPGENPDGVPYFDGLTRWYVDGIYGGFGNSQITYDDFQFSQVTGEPDTLVASVTGTYSGSRYEVSWQTQVNSNQSYDVRYSTTSMKTAGFASGTLAGTTKATNSTYTGAFMATPNMPEAAGGLYIAIQPVGQTAFTEVFVRAN